MVIRCIQTVSVLFISLSTPDVPAAGCETGYENDACYLSLIASRRANEVSLQRNMENRI